MATIKGQNLRIFLADPNSQDDPACIAAATSCTAHIALQVQEDTTKDTEDDWLIKEVTGLSWDVQAEALILFIVCAVVGITQVMVGKRGEVEA